jgi:hypothetical protein
MASDLCAQWTDTTDEALTLNEVRNILAPVEDDLWVTVACHDRLLDNVDVQRGLLEEGLKRTGPSKERVTNLPLPVAGTSTEADETLVSYFKDEPVDAQILCLRASLLGRLDRLNTFVEITRSLAGSGSETGESAEPEWEEDPWGEEDEDGEDGGAKETSVSEPPLSLFRFLVEDLLTSALLAASAASFPSLRVLFRRHWLDLDSHRFTILDAVPEHVHPSEYRDLLPAPDSPADVSQQWRAEHDISESPVLRASLKASNVLPSQFGELVDVPSQSLSPSTDSNAVDLSFWYSRRVDRILVETGMTDAALALVQHGASQGVPGLDELGEELSLMSRMAYRAEDADADDGMSLSRWKAMEPATVVRAYLELTTPNTVAADIRKLVLPYLFVLEARAERAGSPDRTLATRLLHDYILIAPLDIVAAIFDASKPTLSSGQRLIRDDKDMARLALACLYGSNNLSEWATMSKIFECLPVWDVSEDPDNFDEGDTTVASLGAFVTPTTAHPQPTPLDLLMFFQPLPATSLSRVLDILDVHLESGEILSRWNVAAPLRWFLQSTNDHAQQRSRATRMSRRHGGSEDDLDSQEEWEWLLEDMLKLTGTNDAGVSSAFGRLTQDEVITIFFGGLLSTGSTCFAYRLYSPFLRHRVQHRQEPLAVQETAARAQR